MKTIKAIKDIINAFRNPTLYTIIIIRRIPMKPPMGAIGGMKIPTMKKKNKNAINAKKEEKIAFPMLDLSRTRILDEI